MLSMMNRTKTFILLSTLTALLLWAGQAMGGRTGMTIAIVAAAAMNLGSYWFGHKLVLRMYSAQEVTQADAPELFAMTQDLANRASLPMPRLYVIPEDAPNAFATGRDPSHGVVAVTAGLLRGLEKREIATVIAHELGHIKNRDTLIMSVAATLAGALSMIANTAMWSSLFGGRSDEEGEASPMAGLAGVLIAPVAASLVQMSISRAREFLADEAAAGFTGDPMALASALKKIELRSQSIPMTAGTPATAHMFIHNPFPLAGLARLFSTHPSTEERIARLTDLHRNPLRAAA